MSAQKEKQVYSIGELVRHIGYKNVIFEIYRVEWIIKFKGNTTEVESRRCQYFIYRKDAGKQPYQADMTAYKEELICRKSRISDLLDKI